MSRRTLVLLAVVLILGIAWYGYNHSTHALLKPCNSATTISTVENGITVSDCAIGP